MHLLDQVERVKQVGLPGAGRASAHVHTADRAFPAQDNSAAGQRIQVRGMTDFDPGNVSN